MSTWVTPGTEAKSGTIKRNCLPQTLHATKVFEATDERNPKVYQEHVLLLVAWRTQIDDLTTPSDCFLEIFRVMCLLEASMIDASKVHENPPSVGVFLVQDVKPLLT
jgi:hypothetical protein